MKVFIGADHRGYKLKEEIIKWLFEKKYEYADLGADYKDPGDDYTLFASRVASQVSQDKNTKGILLCGSGVGVDVVANKFDGIRASIGKTPEQVKAGRNDDDMNVLVIAADYTSLEEAKEMVNVFLGTGFSGKARYKRRLQEIEKLEENN